MLRMNVAKFFMLILPSPDKLIIIDQSDCFGITLLNLQWSNHASDLALAQYGWPLTAAIFGSITLCIDQRSIYCIIIGPAA